jgi:hypothetical protein
MLIICLTATLISGCTMEEIASVNKQISDGAESLTNTLRGSSDSSSDEGMPTLHPKQQKAKKSTSKNYDIPVDVDTAAARLRRYYKFMTTEELNSIKNREDTSSGWVAGAIEDGHPVWSATAGSYYKMGNDWGDEEHLELEVEKNGPGSRLYITYSSPDPKHLTESFLSPLYTKVKNVAEGTVR